jgi:hypothetical protein
MQVIDERQGTGKLVAQDSTFHEVTYNIAIHQEHGKPSEPAFRKVTGTVSLLDGSGCPPPSQERFVLVLEDGAKLNMYLGQWGVIIPAGGLYK